MKSVISSVSVASRMAASVAQFDDEPRKLSTMPGERPNLARPARTGRYSSAVSEVPGSEAPANKLPASKVEVRRSARRKRSVSAFREGDKVVIAIPARLSAAEEQEWVTKMVERLAARERRRRPSDQALHARALELSAAYLGGQAVPASVRWATNQSTRWGSATLPDGAIRISDRVQGMPPWVLDYVLLHELAHLIHAGHGKDFWALLDGYPHRDRARGFLDGVSFAQRHPDEGSGEIAD